MRRGALAVLLLLLPAARAAGGQIALQLTSTAELTGDTLRVVLTVRNVGDSPAAALRPRLSLGEREVLGEARASLAPGQDFDATLVLNVPGLGPGRWPFRVAVDYMDANAHPFQALQAAVLSSGNPGAFGLEVTDVQVSALAERGLVLVKLRNSGTLERRARVGVLASADLEPPPAASVLVAPGEERAARLPLGVRTALAGSRYSVYVLVEYDDAGVHQSQLVEAPLEVRERRPPLAAFLFAGSALLMLLWAGALGWRRVKKPVPA
jgi:hypothetical protein